MLFKSLIAIVLTAFMVTMVGPLPSAQADELNLPAPGSLVRLSPEYDPALLRGIKVNLKNPFKFDFLIDPGDTQWRADQGRLKESSTKLIKYFLSALTIKDEDMWVNLSPYEKNRIVPVEFGSTDLGRDLLAQDYVLKQMSSSLLYPDEIIGKKFWKTIYEKALKLYGTTNIPVKTFHKIWIVPDTAVVYENKGAAFIGQSHLKVLLEQDYLAQRKNLPAYSKGKIADEDLSTSIMRHLLLPIVEKEVNEGKNFAPLRQAYYSIILATWYKNRLKESILAQIYVGQDKIKGIDIADKNARQEIYSQYLKAFKKGVFNFIKEEVDASTHEIIPRKYFSGGTLFDKASLTKAITWQPLDAMREEGDYALRTDYLDVATNLDFPHTEVGDRALVSNIKKEGSSILQADLKGAYWDNGAVYFERIINKANELADQIKNGEISAEVRDQKIKELVTVVVKEAAEQFGQSQNSKEVEKLRDRFLAEIINGSPQQYYATSMSAFNGEQMIFKDNQENQNVEFPRDFGFLFTAEMAIAKLLGLKRNPGLFYLSGSNATFNDYYGWMSSAISSVGSLTNNFDDCLEKLVKKIQDKEKEDKQFAAKMDSFRRSLENNLKLSGTLNADKIRFVDTGFKTFPMMFAALVRKWSKEPENEKVWKNKKVSALVQQSGMSLSILPQLDTSQWREHVRQYILSHPTAQYASANFGYSESADTFLKHPIQAKTSGINPEVGALDGTLVATSAAVQFEAFWDQICFVLGAIKYTDLLKGIAKDIEKQGVAPDKADELAHGAIQEGMGIVNVTDPNGLQISAMPTILTGTEEEAGGAFTPQEMVKKAEEKIRETIPDFNFSDDVKKQFEEAADSKKKAIDDPAIDKHNAEVREKAKDDKQNPPAGTPSSGNQVVTLFDAEPYLAGLADYKAKEKFNQELTQRKWYNPKKWFLGMTETSNVELRSMDRKAKLRALINEGRASEVIAELGLNSAEELTSSENGRLADIASRDFNLSGETVAEVTDPIMVAKIKALFLDFIKGTINEATFEERVKNDIAPEVRQSTKATAIGSNLLRKAKAIRQDLQNQGVNIHQLQDLNITINFATLKHAFVQTREVKGWWNKAIVKTMNKLQTLPAKKLPVLGVLTSPGFVGATMSIAGQAAVAASRWGVKALAIGGLTGILLPILGTATLIAMGIAVAIAGVVSAFRENTRMWKNLSLLEVREALDLQSQKMTSVEAKMLNNKAVVDKLRVTVAIENLNRMINEYSQNPGITQREALEKTVADILARIDYGYEAKAEFFIYDTDTFMEQETQRTVLLDTVRQAVKALGVNRDAIVTSSKYTYAKDTLIYDYNLSLKNFGRIKLRQVLTASALSMGIALVFSFLSGLVAHWVSAWFHGGSSTAAPLVPAQPAATSANMPLDTFLSKNADKIDINGMRQALIDAHVNSPDEVISDLVKDGKIDATALLKRLTEGADRNLSQTLEKFLDQQLGVNINFGAWSAPTFVSKIWEDPNLIKELKQAGISNIEDFKKTFELKITEPHQGAWSLYGTLKEILKTNQRAKNVETILLKALSQTDETKANLADFTRTHEFLRTEDSVQHFFSNQNGTSSLLERYKSYVVDQQGYNAFLNKVREIYAHKGEHPDWLSMGKQIDEELNKLNPADRNNIVFDIAHRYEGWHPQALTGKASGDFLNIFTDSHREAAIMSVKLPTPTSIPTPSVVPNIPNYLGPALTGGPLTSLGILGKRKPRQAPEETEQKGLTSTGTPVLTDTGTDGQHSSSGVLENNAEHQSHELGQGGEPPKDASQMHKERKGGIDMNTKNLMLDIQGDGSVHFTLDKAQLAQLKEISGFTPDVIRITPVRSLTAFFGIAPS